MNNDCCSINYVTSQLTFIIPDQNKGSAYSFSGIPVIWNLLTKCKLCNEKLIKFQHIIINNGEVPKAVTLAGVSTKSRLVLCTSVRPVTVDQAKMYTGHINKWSFIQLLHKNLHFTWALPWTVYHNWALSIVATKCTGGSNVHQSKEYLLLSDEWNACCNYHEGSFDQWVTSYFSSYVYIYIPKVLSL